MSTRGPPSCDCTVAPVSLYVDAAGSDVNDGLSPATPLLTLAEVDRRLPMSIEHDVLVTVQSVGIFAMPSWRPRLYRGGQIYVRATPVTTVLASTAALSGTGVSVIKSSGLTIDQYIDNWIRMLSGAAVGQRRLIKSNTATDIVPVRDFSVAPAAGDLYTIETPLVVLQGDNGVLIPTLRGTLDRILSLTVSFEPSLNFENFVLDRQMYIVGRVVFWQCKTLVTGILLSRGGGNAMLGADSSVLRGAVAPSRVYGGGEKDWLGTGLVHQFNQEPDAGGFYGFVNATHGLFIRNVPYTQIIGGNIRGDHTTVDGYGVFCFFGSDAAAVVQMIDGPVQNTGTLRVRNGAWCTLQRISLVGQSGDIGIGVTAGGTLDVLGALSIVSVTIVGNTYGIHARSGGRVFTHEAAPNITHTSVNVGTANLAVGEVPTVNNAASLPNVGDVLVAPSGDGSMMTRVE